MKYVIASHVTYSSNKQEVYGAAHQVIDYLHEQNCDYIFIKHGLSPNSRSRIQTKRTEKLLGSFRSSNIFFHSLSHIFRNRKILLRQKDKFVFIGVDPINFLACTISHCPLMAKRIYFTIDYSDRRFHNIILNSIYHIIDRINLLFADEVWSVSSRISKKRTSQGLPHAKNVLLLNTPSGVKLGRTQYDGNHNLVLLANLNESVDFDLILDVLQIAKMNIPTIHLNVIGGGDNEKKFIHQTNERSLMDSVTFLHHMQHDEAMKVVAHSFLGFALYTTHNTWNYYGDSVKIREYAAFSVPSIVNTIPSTADDVRKFNAGLVVHQRNAKHIADFIQKCATDKKYYFGLRENSDKMASSYNKYSVLEKSLLI